MGSEMCIRDRHCISLSAIRSKISLISLTPKQIEEAKMAAASNTIPLPFSAYYYSFSKNIPSAVRKTIFLGPILHTDFEQNSSLCHDTFSLLANRELVITHNKHYILLYIYSKFSLVRIAYRRVLYYQHAIPKAKKAILVFYCIFISV